MTLIIGIKCKDGIVLGADGAATLGAMGQGIILQPMKKLEIISNAIVLGVSGPVGLGQRFKGELEQLWSDRKLSGKQTFEAMGILRQALWKHAKEEWEVATVTKQSIGNIALLSAACQTLLAIPVSKKLCLFQFDQQCAPEEATENLPFVAIGSGQNIADPFLAFLRRVFWPDRLLPSLADGIFATVWTLEHAIKTNPGGVADPKQIVTVKNKGSDFKIRELPEVELEEHIEAGYSAEKYLANFKKIMGESSGTEGTEIPEPKK